MQGMWPYYDKAIGVAIKEAVEPMMEQYKPPGLIKKIYFSKLTFGDAPFRIDNVWVEDEGEQHVLLEARAPGSPVLAWPRHSWHPVNGNPCICTVGGHEQCAARSRRQASCRWMALHDCRAKP